MRILLTSALITLLTIPATVFAAGKATVEVTAKTKSGKKVELSFKTRPAEGLVINHEGPWKLEIKQSSNLKPERTEFKRADWKEDSESFVVAAETTGPKSSDIKYKMVTFVCTKDKSQCFREVVESTSNVSW